MGKEGGGGGPLKVAKGRKCDSGKNVMFSKVENNIPRRLIRYPNPKIAQKRDKTDTHILNGMTK